MVVGVLGAAVAVVGIVSAAVVVFIGATVACEYLYI